jgi:alpha-glucosidase
MLLNMGLSGFPFAGVDIGGFGGHGDPELLIRWYELGIFYPFFRNHCAMGQAAQEPWAFGPKAERAIKKLIATRYALTHYIERLFVEHRETGAPLMRPMAFHYPEDRIARSLDDQFLFGEDLLVAPILRRGKHDRVVYFPKGVFESFERGTVIEGPCHRHLTFKLGEVPAFVRHGAIIPLVSSLQHMGEMGQTTLTLRCYGERAKGRLWLDDGISTSAQAPHGDWGLELKDGRFEAVARHDRAYELSRKTFVEALGKRIAFELP